jgi:hypothetical protein
MTERGLSERRALAVVGMSPSALPYTPAPDRNVVLRARIVALAHRHRRYGAGMIHLKLRQAGEPANHKRVHRLYVAERLQICRRHRKKGPLLLKTGGRRTVANAIVALSVDQPDVTPSFLPPYSGRAP